MRRSMRCVMAVLAMAGVTASGTAQAQCWSENEVRAAKVRDLETMMMVAALRCRGEIDVLSRYNAFVVASRAPLTQVNDTLRAHFAAGIGATAGLDAYDGYVTALANRYGAGAAGLDCADMEAIAQAALSEGVSFEALAELAERAGVEPVLPGDACTPPVEMAALAQ